MWPMKPTANGLFSPVAKVALATVLAAAVTGLAFAAWMENGAGIFLATVEAGLAWCF